jgi:hypothetical protein
MVTQIEILHMHDLIKYLNNSPVQKLFYSKGSINSMKDDFYYCYQPNFIFMLALNFTFYIITYLFLSKL